MAFLWLTTVLSSFLTLEEMTTTYFGVSLTGCHVVLTQMQLGIGFSLTMEEEFHRSLVRIIMELQHSAEPEGVMEQSTCTVSTVM